MWATIIAFSAWVRRMAFCGSGSARMPTTTNYLAKTVGPDLHDHGRTKRSSRSRGRHCQSKSNRSNKSQKHFAFVIDGAPQVMCFTVDADKHLVQMPSPPRIRLMVDALFPDLRGEHRAEPVPPEPYRLVADIDATLEQPIFDLPQPQRLANIHHHCEANGLG